MPSRIYAIVATSLSALVCSSAFAQAACDVEAICRAACPGQLNCYVSTSCRPDCFQHMVPDDLINRGELSSDGDIGLVIKSMPKSDVKKILKKFEENIKP